MIAAVATLLALQAAPGRTPRAQQSAQAGPPAVAPRRFGRCDLDQPKEQLARLPDLKDCADALLPASGHADCAVPRDPDRIARVQIAWEDSKAGGEIVARSEEHT